MDKREALKSMLNNMINDKHEEAALDMHNYLAVKMRDVAGVNPPQQTQAVEAPTVDPETNPEAE